MAHTQNPHGPSSTSADAEAYQQAQHSGRALTKVRTERADMSVEGSQTYQNLIEEPFTGPWSKHIMMKHWSFEFEDEEFTRKLLWWVQ